MPNADEQHDEHVVPDLVDDAVFADADPVELILARELLDPIRSGVSSQRIDLGRDAAVEDLELLEALEHKVDVDDAKKALKAKGGTSWQKFKAARGL